VGDAVALVLRTVRVAGVLTTVQVTEAEAARIDAAAGSAEPAAAAPVDEPTPTDDPAETDDEPAAAPAPKPRRKTKNS